MRRDELYLRDITEATDHLAAFLQGVDIERFEASELIRSAVVQKLAIIGEAATRVSESLRKAHPDVPWAQITAFRNILVHAYFGVDWEQVWNIATGRCPTLRDQIARILADDLPPT